MELIFDTVGSSTSSCFSWWWEILVIFRTQLEVVQCVEHTMGKETSQNIQSTVFIFHNSKIWIIIACLSMKRFSKRAFENVTSQKWDLDCQITSVCHSCAHEWRRLKWNNKEGEDGNIVIIALSRILEPFRSSRGCRSFYDYSFIDTIWMLFKM